MNPDVRCTQIYAYHVKQYTVLRQAAPSPRASAAQGGGYHDRMPEDGPRQSHPYGIFARVYDRIMEDIDYGEWAEFILGEAARRGFTGGRILDLACGTGNSAAPLLRRGYSVVGVDRSEEMLAQARAKFPEGTWLQGEFTSFSAPGRYSLVQSVFDSVNNLLDATEFSAMARRVHEHLEPGGVFMFDVNTSFGLADLWEGGRVDGFIGSDWYGWLHTWDAPSRIATVEAGFLIGGESWLEVHRERAYDQDELVGLLAEAGFVNVSLIEEPWGEPAEIDAPRVWVVAERG